MNRRAGARPSKAARSVAGASLARPWKAAPLPLEGNCHMTSRIGVRRSVPIQGRLARKDLRGVLSRGSSASTGVTPSLSDPNSAIECRTPRRLGRLFDDEAPVSYRLDGDGAPVAQIFTPLDAPAQGS